MGIPSADQTSADVLDEQAAGAGTHRCRFRDVPESASRQGTGRGGSSSGGRPRSFGPARLTGLVLGPALFLLTLLFFEPDGLSREGVAVLASTLWIGTWWITEVVPIPVTSLLPIVLLPVTGAMEGDDVVSSYGDDIVFLFLGGFALAIAWRSGTCINASRCPSC
nr:anion permease [Saccharomonospora sp. CUA-673]